MIKLKKLKIERNSPSHLDVSWEFKETTENLNDYRIAIYRSEAPTTELSEYDLIDSGIDLSTPFYEDSGVDGLRTHTRDWFYRIGLKYLPTNEVTYLPEDAYAYINDEPPNRKWLKIINHKKIALRKDKAGVDFVLLKKRTWGERPDNWDNVLFKTTGDDNGVDNTWGTGWKEGFFKPISFRGMKRSDPKYKDILVWGEFYPSDSVLYTLPTPILTTGDVIVDLKKDLRYHIQRVRTVEMLGVPVEQQAQISLAHPDDEIYNYNVEAYK